MAWGSGSSFWSPFAGTEGELNYSVAATDKEQHEQQQAGSGGGSSSSSPNNRGSGGGGGGGNRGGGGCPLTPRLAWVNPYLAAEYVPGSAGRHCTVALHALPPPDAAGGGGGGDDGPGRQRQRLVATVDDSNQNPQNDVRFVLEDR